MLLGDSNCLLCVRRPRDDGGTGTCPQTAFIVRDNREKSDANISFECRTFKLGDRRIKRRDPEQDGLFG